MSVLNTFNPSYGRGIVVAPGAASAQSTIGVGSKTLVLTNLGVETCYIRVGRGTITASNADYPVLAGTQLSISKDQDDTVVAYISASATATSLHILPGEGW